MRSLDTETTGVDFWHGARPFFVTSCDDRGTVEYWEWDVDPLTRKVQIPAGDWQEVMDILKVAAGWGKLTTDPASLEQHKLVLQNSKFDVTALNSVTEVREPDLIQRTYGPGSTSKITVPPGRINLKTGKRTVAGTNREVTTKITPGQYISSRRSLDDKSVNEVWPWAMTDDTLSAGHVLASGMPHDLTSMAIEYLGINIEPYEVALNKLTEECRRACRSRYPDWQIAAKGRPDMPSAKDKCWKFDGWLPRALARQENLPEPDPACKHQWDDDRLCTACGGHHYWKVLAEYANTDSSVTALLWPVIAEELRRRGLWEIYVEAMRLPPILVQMESKGVTLSKKRLRELRVDYSEESERLGRVMVSIARGYGYDLQLPKSGNNESLLAFCFGKSLELEQTDSKGKVKVKRDRSVRLKDPLCLNLPRVAYTESGAPSLDSKRAIPEYLIRLPANSKERMFIEKLAAKRARDTALTYMISYERFWLPVTDAAAGFTTRIIDTDWYVLHPSLNPTGTITLRLSSSNPNEQNISKREGFNLRHCFGPAPGREWWCMDAKNIEARLPAWESGEQELIDLYNRPDEPPYYGSMHLLNFHTVYPDLWEKELGRVCGDPRCCGDVLVDITRVGLHCKKKFGATWYQWCKNGGFAIQYGCQEPKADNTFKRKGAFKLLKARFAKLENLNQYWINFAEKHGYVETIPDRTVNPNRGYPMMLQRGAYGKIKPTEPLNYHIQGTACQWARKAMTRSQAQLDRWRAGDGFDGHMIMQVHDELDFDFPRAADPIKDPKNSNLGRAQVLAGLMRQGGEDIGIPTPVSLEYCPDTWANSISIT